MSKPAQSARSSDLVPLISVQRIFAYVKPDPLSGREGPKKTKLRPKVEQDIELSPEEYSLALEQEINSLRKRYYIGGVVKESGWGAMRSIVRVIARRDHSRSHGNDHGNLNSTWHMMA